MKPNANFLVLALVLAAFAAGLFYGRTQPTTPSPTQLTLEQVLSIRELHLVKHTYNDLFFLHKKNDKTKAIRAIVQVPVVVSAYLNLKEIELIKEGDSIKQLILPKARMNPPHYQVEKMIVRETRSVQVHVGRDLYPAVGNHLQVILAERVVNVETLAVTQRILVQAEQEGKEYIESLLKSLGRSDILVRFANQPDKEKMLINHPPAQTNQASLLEVLSFGFVPLI
jgi:hypothetical protein